MVVAVVDESRVRTELVELLERHESEIVERWVDAQRREQANAGPMVDEELRFEAGDLVASMRQGLRTELPLGRIVPEFEPLRRGFADLAARWARRGFSPTAAVFAVLAIKDACVPILREASEYPPEDLLDAVVVLNGLVDGAVLVVFETYVQGREDVIRRQSDELLELSTPVVELWNHVLAVPLIGTLDSTRTQVVMESLLQRIQELRARVAIIDITGVATMDTMVAQHLIQTATATRLMGAACIISGIRPETAQTIARLGIDLGGIFTRATLADALATAIDVVGAEAQRSEDRSRATPMTEGGSVNRDRTMP